MVTLLVAVAANVSIEEPSAAGVKVTRIDPESAWTPMAGAIVGGRITRAPFAARNSVIADIRV